MIRVEHFHRYKHFGERTFFVTVAAGSQRQIFSAEMMTRVCGRPRSSYDCGSCSTLTGAPIPSQQLPSEVRLNE